MLSAGGNDIFPPGQISENILSLEMDSSSLITMATTVLSMCKITRGLKIF